MLVFLGDELRIGHNATMGSSVTKATISIGAWDMSATPRLTLPGSEKYNERFVDLPRSRYNDRHGNYLIPAEAWGRVLSHMFLAAKGSLLETEVETVEFQRHQTITVYPTDLCTTGKCILVENKQQWRNIINAIVCHESFKMDVRAFVSEELRKSLDASTPYLQAVRAREDDFEMLAHYQYVFFDQDGKEDRDSRIILRAPMLAVKRSDAELAARIAAVRDKLNTRL